MWKENLLVLDLKFLPKKSTIYWDVFRRSEINKRHSSRNSGGNCISSNTRMSSQGGERILLDDPNYLIKLRAISNRFDFWKTRLFNCSIFPTCRKRFPILSISRIHLYNKLFFLFHDIQVLEINFKFRNHLNFNKYL